MTLKNQAKELVKAINEQDNRCTASPYYYVIQANRANYCKDCDDAGGDAKVIFYYDTEFYTFGELREQYDELKDEDDDYIEDWAYDNDYEKIYRWYDYEDYDGCGIFLTEDSANEFIKYNQHHVGGDARTYVKHFWRNPEMELVFKILERFSEEELINH